MISQSDKKYQNSTYSFTELFPFVIFRMEVVSPLYFKTIREIFMKRNKCKSSSGNYNYN